MPNRNKKKLLYSLLAAFLWCSAFFSLADIAKSETAQQTDAEQAEEKAEEDEEEKAEQIESLEQKARNYQKMIDLKRQQQTTLQNQLELMDIQVQSIENGIKITEDEIVKNKQSITDIERKISEIQNEIEKGKQQMAEMIRAYDQIEQELSMEMLSGKRDLSDVLNGSEYLDQASQKVNEGLKIIEVKKNELNQQKGELDNKNSELKDKKSELDEKIYYLNNEKFSKNIILKETKGEEAKYQVLLERVEQQKQELIGDIDALSSDVQGKLADILDGAPKPKSGTASTSWYYSQRDPKWGSSRIGLSSSLMKDYGCAISAVAMVFTFHGEDITPGKLAKQPIFYRDLIVWPSYWKGLELTSGTSHGNISWSTIDKEIKNDNPVIVFVRASGGRGHYVVVHGKDKKGEYVVHDPYFGSNLYLDTTRKLVGAIYGSSTTIDQMIVYHD